MPWTKCKERMPPEDKGSGRRVLTWDGYTVRENGWGWSMLLHDFTWERSSPRPTHWMPIPKPPKP